MNFDFMFSEGAEGTTKTVTAEIRRANDKYVTYTRALLPLLMSDPDILHIVDDTTGELLK